MRGYIDFNKKERAMGPIEFAKKFYRFVNNNVFGKTLENVRE